MILLTIAQWLRCQKKPFASLLSLALVDCCSSSPWAKTQTALRPLSQQRIFIDLSITLESQIFFVLLCCRVKIVGIGVFIIVFKKNFWMCAKAHTHFFAPWHRQQDPNNWPIENSKISLWHLYFMLFQRDIAYHSTLFKPETSRANCPERLS